MKDHVMEFVNPAPPFTLPWEMGKPMSKSRTMMVSNASKREPRVAYVACDFIRCTCSEYGQNDHDHVYNPSRKVGINFECRVEKV